MKNVVSKKLSKYSSNLSIVIVLCWLGTCFVTYWVDGWSINQPESSLSFFFSWGFHFIMYDVFWRSFFHLSHFILCIWEYESLHGLYRRERERSSKKEPCLYYTNQRPLCGYGRIGAGEEISLSHRDARLCRFKYYLGPLLKSKQVRIQTGMN